MIYTVTFNPSLDYIVSVDDFKLGLTNRTSSELMLPGGKGINVSTVLMNLGIENTALGFTAGFVGKEIIRRLHEMGAKSEFIQISEGVSRINLKLKSIDGTEINGAGPVISKDKVEELMKKLEQLGEGDVLFLAGSIPSSMPDDMYEQIMARLDGKGVMIVVDATKDLLVNVLKYKPFLIKPNNFELGEIFGVPLKDDVDEIVRYAGKLQEMGARNVLVSMAGDGAVLLDENGGVHACGVCKGTVKNSVGAGDSMVAGFVAGCETGDYDYALKLGTATGGATAFSEGLAKKELIAELLQQLM